MGTFFGRRRTDPVGIEFALDLTANTVTLFERAPYSGWKRFAAADLDDPEFPIVIGLLRTEAETHAGGRDAVRIWLPSDQVLRRRTTIEGTTPSARLQSGFDYVANETVYRPEDVAIAVAPETRDGESTVLITFAETWHEAREYVQRWGFLPGAVSTRSHATDFGVDGPVFRPQGQVVEQQRPLPRRHFAVAASVALVVTGAALGWGLYPQFMALIDPGSAEHHAEAPEAEPAPTEPATLAAAQSSATEPTSETSIAPVGLSSTAPTEPPQIAAPAETATTESVPSTASTGPSPIEPLAAPTPVEQAPLDEGRSTQIAATPGFNLEAPHHVATVPTLAPRTASAKMPDLGPDLGPGSITLATYTAAPAGPTNQSEAISQPAAPPGPALPDPKLLEVGAWNGLDEPPEAGEPLPKLAALDLVDEPAAAIDHDDVLAALGVADPLGDLPLPAPSNRPQISAPAAVELRQQTSTEAAPSISAPSDQAPASEGAVLANRNDDSAGLPPPAPEPAEPRGATKYAAKFAPQPVPALRRSTVSETDLAERNETAVVPDQPFAAYDPAEALASFDITIVPDLDQARTSLPMPPQAPSRAPAGTPPEAPIEPFAAYDPAEELASLDITIVPNLEQARTSLPFPQSAPNRDPTEDSGEASTDQDVTEPSAPAEAVPQTEPPQTVAASEVPAPGAASEPSVAYDPAELLASLDVKIVPDLDEARATLPFPPPAPGRPAAGAAVAATMLEEDETSDEPGIGPLAAALPRARPTHLTRIPEPTSDAAAPDPAEAPVEAQGPTNGNPPPISSPDPARATALDPATIAALLPHGALIPEIEPNPDAPTRYASLTSPYPSARPAVKRSLPGVNALKLPKLSPSSVRDAATEQGLPLDQVALIGVLDLASGRKALLRLPDGRYRSVVTGDTLDGWRVSLIGVDAMRVTRSGKNRTLLLVNR